MGFWWFLNYFFQPDSTWKNPKYTKTIQSYSARLVMFVYYYSQSRVSVSRTTPVWSLDVECIITASDNL